MSAIRTKTPTCTWPIPTEMSLSMAKKKSGLKPGQNAPASGQYRQVGPRGGKGPEVTAVKGKPLPPTTLGHRHLIRPVDGAATRTWEKKAVTLLNFGPDDQLLHLARVVPAESDEKPRPHELVGLVSAPERHSGRSPFPPRLTPPTDLDKG